MDERAVRSDDLLEANVVLVVLDELGELAVVVGLADALIDGRRELLDLPQCLGDVLKVGMALGRLLEQLLYERVNE